MLSKWLPWDFIRNHPDIVSGGGGVIAISHYDSYIERIILRRLYQHNKNTEFKKMMGQDLSIDWLEENLGSLDLFQESTSFLILQTEGINKNVQRYLLDKELDLKDYFLLSFIGQDSFFTQLAKDKKGTFLKVDEPRFWEGGKLLNFLMDELKIRLPYDVQNYILGSLPNFTKNLIEALELLNLHFPGGEGVNLAKTQELISPYRVDQFQLASLYGERKRVDFFSKVLELDIDFDGLRGIFSFMQGHLFRLLDPSYIERKARPSKYDKEIMVHAKLWKSNELKAEMRLFGQLEIAAKSRDAHLKDLIRSEYLRSF